MTRFGEVVQPGDVQPGESQLGDVVLVLAGGRSSRFGRDKACEPFSVRRAPTESVEPLALRALRRLAPLATRRALIRAAPIEGVPGDVVVVADPRPGDGPLQALATAFQAMPAARWFVAPCDLPWLDVQHYRRLAAAIGSAPVAFARTPRGDEPLVSLWTPIAAEALIHRQRAAPRESARVALAALGAVAVDTDDGRAFLNVNTLSDLEMACSMGEEER